MADPITITNPYSVDPATYVQSALTPMTGHTFMPTMTPAAYNAQSFYGPTHAALSQAFQSALQQQLGVPGLLSQMQADPALAHKIGGLLSSYYTPPAPSHYSIDWAAAQAAVPKPAAPVDPYLSNDGGNSSGSGGSCCFDPNAPVMMADGSWKRIADVQVGDKVMNAAGYTNTVVATKTTTVGTRAMMQFAGHEFFATDDHLFLTTSGWKTWRPDRLVDNNRENAVLLEGSNRSSPLENDDKLLMRDATGLVEVAYADQPASAHDFEPDYVVHDLHLDGDRTYVVDGFIVHNCGSDGGGGGW